MSLPPADAVKGIFFDLDGTLLQVEMKKFIPAYVSGLASCFEDVADRHLFSEVMLSSTMALLRNSEGRRSNEELFLESLSRHLGIERDLFNRRLQQYCANGLHRLTPLVHPLELSRRILERCFARGLKVVLATNPVFPRAVVEARLQWGGLLDFPFELVTTYENCRYCKPHVGYFADILDHLGLAAEECVMVGNDTDHDLSAHRAGMATFLVDTWVIDRGKGAYTADFRGGHLDLFRFVESL